MPWLCRFSDEEIQRMKRLKFSEGRSYSSIAEIINRDRPSDRHCTSRGVRTCLNRSNKSKCVYNRKLGFAALAFIDAEVNADREISGRELQTSLQQRLCVSASISLINRERRRMGWATNVMCGVQNWRGRVVTSPEQATNPFLHSHTYSFRTAFMDLILYWIKGALLFVLVSGYVC